MIIMKKNKILIIAGGLFLIANIAMATTFAGLITNLTEGIFLSITKLAFGFSTVFFFWGIFTFVLNAADPSEREKGKSRMIFGIFAIFIMLSLWGILEVFTNSVTLDNQHLQITLDGATQTTGGENIGGGIWGGHDAKNGPTIK